MNYQLHDIFIAILYKKYYDNPRFRLVAEWEKSIELFIYIFIFSKSMISPGYWALLNKGVYS